MKEDTTEGKSRDKTRSLANTMEAQLLKIMYGEESMARELKEEGRRVGHKKKKSSRLCDVKNRKWHAKGKMKAGAPPKSDRDEEAQVQEEGGSQPFRN